jgi:hypothetical protein
MKFRSLTIIICVLMGAFAAQAQSAGAHELRGGWTVRYNETPEFWRLYHSRDSELKNTIILVWADRRGDISMAQAFEEAKVQRGNLDNCPALVTAETRPEYDPYSEAMLALTKIKDPDAYKAMEKDLPAIGYEAADDERSPHCVLIAREFTGGAMLYAFISDRTNRLETKLGSVRNAVHRLMDQINETEVPREPAPAVPSQRSPLQSEAPDACQGKRQYEDWIMSWSPEIAAVHVRHPEFMDPAKMSGKKARLSVNIGGKVDAMKGREDPYLNITIAAEANGQGLVPQKNSLKVDGQTVQEWGEGGGQWTVLSDRAIEALLTGTHAELDTVELGRIGFQLGELGNLLKLADIAQHKAVMKTRLGDCVA